MKSSALAYGGILLILIISSLTMVYIVGGSEKVNMDVVSVEGKLTSFADEADMISKTFNQSIEFISQRSAYDLGLNGGTDNPYTVWSNSYPTIDDLKTELEKSIKNNLPSSYIKNNINVIWEESEIDVSNYDGAPCGSIINSKCFLVSGEKNFSVYNKPIDTRIDFKPFKINSFVNSSYFKLLAVGRKILGDAKYNSNLNNAANLKNLLKTDFPDLDFQITILSTAPVDPSLVGYWSFDEGLGNIVNDNSGNGNNGIINGATWVNGKYGEALQFDGSSNYVDIPDSASLRASNNQVTVEMWIKRNQIPAARIGSLINKMSLIGGSYSCTYCLEVPSDLSFPPLTEKDSKFYFETSSILTPVSFGLITDYNWHHLAATYDGNALKSYLDGNLYSTKTPGINIPFTNTPVRIGGDTIQGSYFNGTIDEVKIYNRSLTALEIKKEYNPSSNGVEVTITDNTCLLHNEYYCLAPLKQGETGITIGGKQIPYDYLKLKFRIQTP